MISRRIDSIDLVELLLVLGAQKCEMILDSLVVDSVELGDSRVGTDQVSVSQESPHLSEGHRKRLFALVGLNLSRVDSVPLFQLRVMSQENVLDLFQGLVRVCLELHQVCDVNELFEWVVLNFFLCS